MQVSKSSLTAASKCSRFGLFAGSLLLAGCGSSSSSGVSSQSGIPGEELSLPGGSGATFFVDENLNGGAASFQIAELLFGRLVDIHDVDGSGATNAVPVFVDFLVELDQLGGANYRLEQNPMTGRERLVILAERALDPTGFNTLLSAASDELVQVVSRNDDGMDPGPFSSIPRNCSVSIRFNDMLSDGAAEVAALSDNVKMLLGNLPTQPYFARVLFDPNHGALLSGSFHSTRVIVDLAVSDAEAAASAGMLSSNVLGLPAGDSTVDANVSIRIPTRLVAAGQSIIQLTLLRGVNGLALDFAANGPVRANATLDVVRAFRPGNSSSADNGFMPDNEAPEILGVWDMTVNVASNDPSGSASFDFLVDMQFDTACRSDMEVGDMIELGSMMLTVQAAAAPDMAGLINGLQLRSMGAIANPNSLLGSGFFVSPLDPALTGVDGCWLSFSPAPATPITGSGPVAGIATTANLNIRFSEPMDPASLSLLDRMYLIAGNASTEPNASNRVAGSYVPNGSFDNFTLVHPLPFSHQTGVSEAFTLQGRFALDDPTPGIFTDYLPTDLAGNLIANVMPDVEFTLNSSDASSTNSSLILRFDRFFQDDDTDGTATKGFGGVNEVDDPNSTSGAQLKGDYSGDFTLDRTRGQIRGREVQFQSFVIDGSQPSVAFMLALNMDTGIVAPPTGVPEPLNRLGAKTQTLWRLFDMGMYSNQASSMNVDVVGINWSPVNGVVTQDFFPDFEMRLGTSERMPEESYTFNAPSPAVLDDGDSGLNSLTAFADSRIGSMAMLPALPGVPLTTVHARSRGYTVRAIDRFNASTGTPMIAYPLNQGLAPGEALSSYTWRDSGNLDASAQMIDIPTVTDVFYNKGTLPSANLESETRGAIQGSTGNIQAAVMPLLMEFNCFASANAIGTNRFSVGLLAPGVDASFKPYSRLYSAGGTNNLGFPQTVNPDSAIIPSGGFNPMMGGAATSAGDNVYYLGQLDTVYRVTRLVTHWIDLVGSSFTGSLVFSAPIMEPAQNAQPLGTSVQLAFRSATGFSGSKVRAFDPAFHGPNGDPVNHFANGSMHSINFQAANSGTNTVSGRIWNADVTQMKSRYMQIRISFVNNIDTGTTPFLSALGLPFDM